MPRRDDLESILLIGSGPIIIGQACEFDYSGTQAVRALKEEGYRVVLVNSNPATIMTDPDLADRTYIEPITAEWVERVIERERPDAILPTMGGQTALNVAMELDRAGTLYDHGVELIGADARSIEMAEDREHFSAAMRRIGLELPHGGFARHLDEALAIVEDAGYPAIIRPSFTLGGTGGGIAYNLEEFRQLAQRGLDASPITEILVDRSVIGWKEYEFEVVRDGADNVVIVCSIENFDPMGVHTGDSITVAPAQTLSDREFQRMRDASIACIREIGVAAGGCNIQFAVNPEDGEMLVVEMNPRVSRSSALASKATGFPIARVGAKLAVGYHLHELPNDITRTTPASFEPVLDYCVVKIPRFAFEKFPEVNDTLGVQMQSVGETMAIGRNFRAAWQKGFRGLETGRAGWTTGASADDDGLIATDSESLLREMARPSPERPFIIRRALEAGIPLERIRRATRIDPWFLDQLSIILELEREYRDTEEADDNLLRRMKREGFSDSQLARLRGETEADVRERRWSAGITARFNVVDTCAGEFPAATPYYYSSYESENESVRSGKESVVILGSGPNRIGQGIEFDYCCVQAVLALREAGYETIMINSNPETVSTDFDVSDKLYFEPLTLEDVLEVVRLERPKGVIVQLGGQTPLKLARALDELGAPVLGTSVDAIDRAEDRDRFADACRKIGARMPPNGIARSEEEALAAAREIGFPVLVRPSYVLGGRAMRIVYDEEALARYFAEAARASESHPVLVDSFLEDAFEADVDALCDGEEALIGGIMQHIEDAGVHSGDSACVLPPYLLPRSILDEISELTKRFALELGVVGLINVQYAIKDGLIYVLEVNPRASRTVPFVGKATGAPLARIAARLMAGERLADMELDPDPPLTGIAVKEAVMPFDRFDVDIVLGPEMRSTGEVMGFDDTFGMAFAKAQLAAGNVLPESGRVIFTVNDGDKETITPIVRRLQDLGFEIAATKGTRDHLRRLGIPAARANKVGEARPDIVDEIVSGEVALLVNTPLGEKSQFDDYKMRRSAIMHRVPYLTTMSALSAACDALIALRGRRRKVRTVQERLARVPAGV